MPLVHVNATPDGPTAFGASAPLGPVLRRHLDSTPGPVTLMIHGYKYQPGHPIHCPFGGLFSAEGGRSKRHTSWPRHLGLLRGTATGLGIGFGWAARGSIWTAQDNALTAAAQLTEVIAQIRRHDPTRTIHMIGHSLGGRVALHALRQADEGAVSRVILLAAAAYTHEAESALQSPAGRRCQMLNVISRENDVFDFILESLVRPPVPGDRMLGHGHLRHRNLATLQLDDSRALQALQRIGFRIAAPDRRICHWSPYLRGGVFALYRSVLSGDVPLALLQDILPDAPAPRWSRLMPPLRLSALPPRRRAATSD
ncbi:MAG: alpha/beta fold hydrolase [Paracoccaceae bacterium]|nr:alpha/beta fold hydrolase [Paracoccaceae bacterium]